MYQTLKRLYCSKLLYKNLFEVIRAKAASTAIISIRVLNSLIISLTEIIYLTEFVIQINLKKIINQIINSTRRRATSARMSK